MRIEDAHGNPAPGVKVKFRVDEGGGSVTPSTVTTDREGRAYPSEWMLGETVGVNVLVADLGELGEERFEMEGTPGLPAELEQMSAENKRGRVGEPVDDPPAVRVSDEFGNRVPNVKVAFEPAEGDGVVEGSPAVTDTEGVAGVTRWTLGTTARAQQVELSVVEPAGAPAAPLTIMAEAGAGPPAQFEDGDVEPPEGQVATSVQGAPAVRVRDEYGNPVPGASVTFEPRAGAGSITGSPAESDGDGVARAEAWELGTGAGIQEVEAFIGQGPGAELDPHVLEVLALPGPPEELVAASPTFQEGTPGEPVPEVATVRVEDAYGNAVPDVGVAFTVTEGGGQVSGSPAVSDEEGLASPDSWTLGPNPGMNRLVASSGGLDDVTFEAEGAARLPDRLVEVSDPAQEAEVATEVPEPPAVRVLDEDNVPVPGVSVVFEPDPTHGTVAGTPATSGSDGVARVDSWTLGTPAGAQALKVSVVDEPDADVDPLTLTATALPGPPDQLIPEAPTWQSGTTDQPVDDPPAVRVVDEYGNAVPDVSVAFTVTEGGGQVSGSPATSDGSGLAELGSWVLGSTPGLNRVEASVGVSGVSQMEFEADASAPPEGGLTVEAVHLNQASQDFHGTIGGVSDRPGLLRVIVEAEDPNSWAPEVVVRLSQGGSMYREETIPAPSGSVPTDPDLTAEDDTWNLALPASDVRTGMEVEVIVDPDEVVTSDDVRFPPGGGTASLDVQPIPTLNLELFPIHYEDENTTGNIHSGNLDDFLSSTEQWIPMPGWSANIRSTPFSTDEDLSTTSGWAALLGDLQAVRDAEGASDEYYHGIVPDFQGIALGGIAYVPSSPSSAFRTGLTYDRFPFAPGTLAHELSHNMGQGHAPCPGTSPSGIDPNFPYSDGSIGVPGYDIRGDVLVDPGSHSDYMTYCRPRWTSDYMYNEVLEWRRADPYGAPPAATAEAGEGGTVAGSGAEASGLLLWGGAGPEGVRLNPAFSLETRPSLPVEDGPLELRGVDAGGGEVFRLTFAGVAPSEPHDTEVRHFSYFVPLSAGELEAVERIELSTPWGREVRSRAVMAADPAAEEVPAVAMGQVGPDGLRVEWDAARAPAVMVRHRKTGHVLGIGRTGELNLLARDLASDDVEVLVSDGIRSRAWQR